MPDEILADIALEQNIEARRLAIAFLYAEPEPCVGDMDRLKRANMAAYLIVVGLLENDKERKLPK